MLDAMMMPRPGCQPLPGIATFLAGLPQRVAADGFYIPSPGVATSYPGPSFTFPSFTLHHPGGAAPTNVRAQTTPPCTPRGREVAATIANMGQRVADDGFYIPSPAVSGSDVGSAFTFDDLHLLTPCCPGEGRDLDLDKTPPITPRGREVAHLLTSMGRRTCQDVTSPLVHDLGAPRQDDVMTSSVFSDADVTTMWASLTNRDVDDVASVTSQTALSGNCYNFQLPPSSPVPDSPLPCEITDEALQQLIAIDPTPVHCAPDDVDVTVTLPEYVLTAAERVKRARRSCRRPQQYAEADSGSEADVVTAAPPAPPRRTRRNVQRRQNSARRSIKSAPVIKTEEVIQSSPVIKTEEVTQSTPVVIKTEPADPTTPAALTTAASTATWSPCPRPRGGRNRKSLGCPMCERVFTSAFSLRQHANTHTGARPYVCDICHKDFAQRTTMRTHRRLHTGERPYSCRHCPRAYSDYSTWTKHERTHTGARPYTCGGCGAGFTQSGNLRRHMGACRG